MGFPPKGLQMRESLCIDSLLGGWPMPKPISGTCGCALSKLWSRRVATRGRRTFDGERELGDKVAAELARQKGRHAQARGGSISPLEQFAAEVLGADFAEQPDLDPGRDVTALLSAGLKTSRSSLWRFSTDTALPFKKKPAGGPDGSEQIGAARRRLWIRRAKACFILPGWCLSTTAVQHQHGCAQGAGSAASG